VDTLETGGKLPEKLSRIILQYPSLILKLNVKIKNENSTFHNEFSFGDKKYINININSYLTLEVPKTTENQDYDPSKSFLIGLGNIGNVVKKLKNVLNNIYKENIFAIQNNNVIAYEDMVKKYTEQITIPRLGQALLIKPAVIYDENETSYEGVNIYVNNSNNIISLSIDEYENFVYVLEHIDLFSYSQMLLNYFIVYASNKDKINNFNMRKITYRNKTIDWNIENTGKVTSNYRKEEADDLFDEL